MTRFATVLTRIKLELDSAGYSFALVGGLAVSVWTEPRFTRDVDLAVGVPTDADAEKLIHHLLASGFLSRALVEQDDVRRLATIRLHSPQEGAMGFPVDLLFASTGIEREIVEQAVLVEVFEGVRVPVARPGHLLAMKLLSQEKSTRPQDELDLSALRGVCDAEELQRARTAVSLVVRRGFSRGRKLGELLEQFLEQD